MDRMINLNNQQLIIRLLSAYAIVSFGAILYLIATHIQSRRALDTGLIRANGIILLDSAGRERILIGAPIPYSDDRIRTDTTRVRELWSEQLGGASYMEWYQSYRHSCNGMLLLNDQGYDVLAVGDELPDPNTGNRITEPTGILWNDSLGFERGGLGLGKLLSNGLYRNILGLDDENGEGFHLSILEDGTKSMRIVSDSQLLFLG